MDTYLATLPPNWSDHFSKESIKNLALVLGQESLRVRLAAYLEFNAQDDLLNLYSKAPRKKSEPIPSKVVHYNLRPPEAPKKMPVLGKGKKLTGTYVTLDDPNW